MFSLDDETPAVKYARPTRLSESDPPALRCEALRAGGGQALLSFEI